MQAKINMSFGRPRYTILIVFFSLPAVFTKLDIFYKIEASWREPPFLLKKRKNPFTYTKELRTVISSTWVEDEKDLCSLLY